MSMEQWAIGVCGLVAMVASVVSWGLRIKRVDKGNHRYALPATVFTALAGLLAVMWWIRHTEPTVSRIDILKAGGFAATAIVALYALWLNDRRRRIEEDRRDIEAQRREIENDRQQLETRKVGNEQFTRAVELLGHAADQVRVGALHALHSQAVVEPDRIQTVLDVLCAYLRRPFDHGQYRKYEKNSMGRDDEDDPMGYYVVDEDEVIQDSKSEEYAAAERERQVRLTAQRLISKTLNSAPNGRFFDLDLTGATLENFALDGGNISELVLRNARVFLDFSISNAHVREVAFDEAEFPFGELEFNSVKIAGDLDLRLVKLALKLRIIDVGIGGDLVLSGAELNWGGNFDRIDLAGDFNCRAWLGHGLIVKNFTLNEDALLGVGEGNVVFRDDEGRVTAIYNPEVLRERNIPDLATSLRSRSSQE